MPLRAPEDGMPLHPQNSGFSVCQRKRSPCRCPRGPRRTARPGHPYRHPSRPPQPRPAGRQRAAAAAHRRPRHSIAPAPAPHRQPTSVRTPPQADSPARSAPAKILRRPCRGALQFMEQRRAVVPRCAHTGHISIVYFSDPSILRVVRPADAGAPPRPPARPRERCRRTAGTAVHHIRPPRAPARASAGSHHANAAVPSPR